MPPRSGWCAPCCAGCFGSTAAAARPTPAAPRWAPPCCWWCRETSARYGADYTLEPGDRLCPGEGPALAWADWPAFVPGARDDVAVVQYVLPMTLGGAPHHVEAGGLVDGAAAPVRTA